jgi:hypothetical protein
MHRKSNIKGVKPEEKQRAAKGRMYIWRNCTGEKRANH